MARNGNALSLTADQEARVVFLLKDGLTSSWIADDLGIPLLKYKSWLRKQASQDIQEMGQANAREFSKVWGSIRVTQIRNGRGEYWWHCQIRPAEMNA